MKILLSGGSGMVGQNILRNSKSNNFKFYAPSSNQLNLLDKDSIKKFLNDLRPDLIIHAAGQVGGIQANIDNPVKFLSENAFMGMNLITEAYNAGIKNLLNLSSSCMYPKNAQNPLKEEYILTGKLEPTNEGYALAKTLTTRLCEYIVTEDASFSYKTVIPCNLYGKYDKFDLKKSHLIPAVINKIDTAIKNKHTSVEIWGDGSARREFMSATDFANFIFYAINKIDLMPQNLNVGLGYDHSIKEYYEAVSYVLGFKGNFTFNHDKPVGMNQKLVDITNLKKFGWRSKISLKEGIQDTYKHYLKMGN